MNKGTGLREHFLVTIGLEVHAELLTRTKMFSSSLNVYGADANTAITELDLGYPGSMPSVNRKAVELGVVLGNALDMQVESKNVRFDRKHYFYADLPKGYQITQFYHPIGIKGRLKVLLSDKSDFTVEIDRIHLEEDSAKSVVDSLGQAIDYNRAGVPLVEIVTSPCMHTADQAMSYLVFLKRLLQFKRVSFARMEEGSLRCDVNISVAPVGAAKLGVRAEIKNLNSIANVGKAIEFEINRQIGLAVSNQPIKQETRRWDEQRNETVFMREKTDAIDYRYITEPNLAPVGFTDEEVALLLSSSFKDPAVIYGELLAGGLSANEADNLLSDFELYSRFEYVAARVVDMKQAYKWVCVEAVGQLMRAKRPLSALSNPVLYEIAMMITAIQHGRINGKQAKEIIGVILDNGLAFEQVMATGAFNQITDDAEIGALVTKLINENPDMVSQYSQRPERVEKFIVGMVMKQTDGQANPIVTANIVKAVLGERFKTAT